MNTHGVPYKENENPFAYDTENAQTEARRPTRETPFSFFADDTTAAAEGAGNRDSNVLKSSKFIKLQRCNIVLRFATSVFCLATILLIVLSRQKKSGIQLINGDKGTGTATYRFNGSFKFLLIVHIVVLLYSLLLSGLAIVMWKKGLSLSTPPTIMWPVFVLNMITAGFLLLAFSAGVAVEVVARQGLELGSITWQPICKWFGFFCFMNELALATAGLAYLCFAGSTAIDSYFIHLHKL